MATEVRFPQATLSSTRDTRPSRDNRIRIEQHVDVGAAAAGRMRVPEWLPRTRPHSSRLRGGTARTRPRASARHSRACWRGSSEGRGSVSGKPGERPPAPRPNNGLANSMHIWGATPCIKTGPCPRVRPMDKVYHWSKLPTMGYAGVAPPFADHLRPWGLPLGALSFFTAAPPVRSWRIAKH
jgi:hypothetical protein